MPVNDPEIIEVDNTHVVCGGVDSDSDHPLIYLTINLSDKDFIDCPYCDRRFFYMRR